MMGNELNGAADLLLGAVVNPGATDLPLEIDKMKAKVDAGAGFLQSQAVYEPAMFARFTEATADIPVPVLCGVILIKSAKMARYMNEKIPGIHIPEKLIAEIDGADDKGAKSIEIAARIINEIKPLCAGIHVMPMGWEAKIPGLLQAIA